jgi:predicted Zn-ribbon and HTH transcriptional regulator
MNKPYFVYHDDDGMELFSTREEQQKYLKNVFENYFMDGGEWVDGVESLCAGVLTEEVKQTSYRKRPKHIPIDQTYYSKHGEDEMDWYAGIEEYFDYNIVPVDSVHINKGYKCKECGHTWNHKKYNVSCAECGSEDVVGILGVFE